MQDRKRVTIIETAHHFLYLPVHYAKKANWFGCVPAKYEILLGEPYSNTDREAYQMLIKGEGKGKSTQYYEFIGFAVADPAELLHDEHLGSHLSQPAVLAGLITNSSFWAVDHNRHTVRFLSDLAAFDKIISFSEGTTSHGIATRIYRDARKKSEIQQVELGSELRILRDNCADSAGGTMALTPDLLALDTFLNEHDDYKVELPLGKTPEYNNVLVTALISRADVINDHPDLVQGLLMAIQRAMLLVRFADPEVVTFAMNDHGEIKERVMGALRRAADAQVFPATIEVSEAHWENAARAAAAADGRDYDKNEHDRVRSLYRSAVTPWKERFMPAICAEILPRLKTEVYGEHALGLIRRRGLRGGVFGLIAGVLLGTALAYLRQPLLLLGFAFLAAGGYLTLILPMNPWVHKFQAFWLVIGVGVLVWWALAKPDNLVSAAPLWGWLGIEVTILLTAAGNAKR